MKQSELILGKREIQKQQVRERILDEALSLFSERGFEKTTVADIVGQCDIARGTFYNYFPDMNSLFDALINQLNQRIIEAIQHTRKQTDNLYDYLYGTFKSYFDQHFLYAHVETVVILLLVNLICFFVITRTDASRFGRSLDTQQKCFSLASEPVLVLELHQWHCQSARNKVQKI